MSTFRVNLFPKYVYLSTRSTTIYFDTARKQKKIPEWSVGKNNQKPHVLPAALGTYIKCPIKSRFIRCPTCADVPHIVGLFNLFSFAP